MNHALLCLQVFALAVTRNCHWCMLVSASFRLLRLFSSSSRSLPCIDAAKYLEHVTVCSRNCTSSHDAESRPNSLPGSNLAMSALVCGWHKGPMPSMLQTPII